MIYRSLHFVPKSRIMREAHLLRKVESERTLHLFSRGASNLLHLTFGLFFVNNARLNRKPRNQPDYLDPRVFRLIVMKSSSDDNVGLDAVVARLAADK